MKAFGCIIISVVAIYALVPALGYEVKPQYGRSNLFGLFSSQSSISRYTSLLSRFSTLQSSVDVFGSHLTALQTLVNILEAKLNALPKCPAAATGGIIINAKCYTVITTAAGIKFQDAKAACGAGSLAEPPPTVAGSTAFYAALKAKFPTQFNTIETTAPNTIWIGYVQATTGATNPFIASVSGTSVLYDVPLFGPPLPALTTGVVSAAALKGSLGDKWVAFDSTSALALAVAPKAHICQYDAV